MEEDPVMLDIFILFPNGFWYTININQDVTGEQLKRQIIHRINTSQDELLPYHRANILLYMSNLPMTQAQPYHFPIVSAWQLLLNSKKHIPSFILPDRTLQNNHVSNHTVINVGIASYSLNIRFMNDMLRQEIIQPITQRIIDLKTLIMSNPAMVEHIAVPFDIDQIRLYIVQEDEEIILCENNALLSTYHLQANSIVNILIQDMDMSDDDQDRNVNQAKPIITAGVISPSIVQTLKRLLSNVWHINLESSMIGNNGLLVLEQGIVACDSIRAINLESNNIGGLYGVATLARIVSSVPTLTEIMLRDNHFDNLSELVRVLPRTILNLINLENNNINEASMNLLLEQIPMTSIVELFIGRNPLRVSSVTRLAGLLHDNQLMSLSIYQCGLDTERTSMIAQELANCPSLKYLDIHSNPMDSDGINALIQALPNTRISMLNLSNTGMVSANLIQLAQLLPNCLSLQNIGLSNNLFGNAGVTELILRARESNIKIINIRDCFIDSTIFTSMMLEALANTRITRLIFDLADIEDDEQFTIFIQPILAILEQNKGKPMVQHQGRKVKRSKRRCRSCGRKSRSRRYVRT